MKTKAFSKKLLIADYIIAIALVIGYFICVAINGVNANQIIDTMLQNGYDISYSTIPQVVSLDGFGILLGSWVGQLAVSSGAYYIMSKSDHKVQLPMAMINTMPDDIKDRLDMTAVVTTLLSSTDN